MLAKLAVLRGDLDQARWCLDRMAGLIGTGITAPPEDVAWPRAKLLIAEGSFDQAFALITQVYERPTLVVQEPRAAATLVGLAVQVGEHDKAAAVVEATSRLARRNPGLHAAAGAAAHAAGVLHRDQRQLCAAVTEFRRAGRPLALASALEDSTLLGRDNTDQSTVRGWYDEALALFTASGAHGARRQLQDGLGAWRGAAPTPAPAGEPVPCLPQLSSAERAVALLVGQGLTNIVVGRRLHLSPHTVDSHLRKIFMKLDLHSRVELAAVVARECQHNPEVT
jgi:DNA-binding CsgD family transcriptional regulator